jgi:cytoskeletal protein RodZ
MTSIGSQLKEARERRGITAAEAAKRLHMRAMFVDALEREAWSSVGEPVYVRGFIRNYARMLGLESQPLVDSFNEIDGPVVSPLVAENIALADRTHRPLRYPFVLGMMTVIAVILVAKVVWTMATPGAAGHNEVRPTQAQAQTTNDGTVASIDHHVGAAPAVKQGVDLRLQLTQSCWLSITVDGKRVVYETLPAGTVKQFHGVREISIRAGNAGGVVATIDGQPLGTLGNPGQVQDRVFAVKTPPIGQSGLHE